MSEEGLRRPFPPRMDFSIAYWSTWKEDVGGPEDLGGPAHHKIKNGQNMQFVEFQGCLLNSSNVLVFTHSISYFSVVQVVALSGLPYLPHLYIPSSPFAIFCRHGRSRICLAREICSILQFAETTRLLIKEHHSVPMKSMQPKALELLTRRKRNRYRRTPLQISRR